MGTRKRRTLSFKHNFRLLHSDALATTFSALYGKLLVVMGIAFPMAEVISTYIPPSFYEGFYLYLYFGSMIFLVYMYATLLRDGKSKSSKSIAVIARNSFVHLLFFLSFSFLLFFLYIHDRGYKRGRMNTIHLTFQEGPLRVVLRVGNFFLHKTVMT